MPENMKRKITVEASTSKSKDTSRRPSVFERLGTKASNSVNASANPVSTTVIAATCRHWVESGICPYGKNCKYAITHTLISPSKQRLAVKDTDIKLKTVGLLASASNPGINTKEDLNKRLHSAVVRKTHTGGSPDINWENWDQTDLEYEDEKELEKRRLLLQRELERQMSRDTDDHKKPKKKVKKVKKGVSSSSSTSASSSSSTDSSSSSDDSSSTSSSTSADSRRKKLKSKSGKRESSSSTSGTDRAQAKKKSSKGAKGESLPAKKTVTVRKDEQRPLTSKKRESPVPKKVVPVASNQALVKKRSATPTPRNRHRSATPPHSSDSKNKPGVSNTKKVGVRHNLSPAPKRSLSADRKDKRNQSASPRSTAKDRDRDREREREKLKEKERDKERDREKERDKGRAQDRSRSPPKGKGKDRLSPPKRNSRPPRDSRKKESPDKDKGGRSPGKSRRSVSRGRVRDGSLDSKHVSTKSSPVVGREGDKRESTRNDSRDPRDKGTIVKKTDRDIRKGEADKVVRGKDVVANKNSGNRNRDETGSSRRDGDANRESSRKINPGGLGSKSTQDRDFGSKNDKDRSKDPRDSSRDNRDNRDNREGRDNADPRLARSNKSGREIREAAREKEREEALERCKERQRERDRKAREEKAREHERELPSLLMIATHNPIKNTRNGAREGSKGPDKGSDRGSDRGHDKERAPERERDLDKSLDRERTAERGDRDRGTNRPERDRPAERDRGLDRDRSIPERAPDRDRTSDRGSDRANERDQGLGRERSFDRGPDHDRPPDRGLIDRERGPDRGPDRERGSERDRAPDRGPIDRERSFDRGADRPSKGPHDRGVNRGPPERGYDRGSDRSFDRDSDRAGFDRGHLERDERDYPLPPRPREDSRRPPLPLDDKGPGYDSPYDGRRGRDDRGRYGDQLERNRYDEPIIPRSDQRRPGPDARNFVDDRRGRRDGGRNSLEPQWEGRARSERGDRRPGFDRGEESRSPGPPIKGRDWETRDYSDSRREWDGRGARRGPPPDWDHQRRGDWIDKDGPIEEDWDMYGGGPNQQRDWPLGGGGERWPSDEWDRPPRSGGGPLGRPQPRLPPHRDEPPEYALPREAKLDVPAVEDGKEPTEDVAQIVDKVLIKEDPDSVAKKPADEPELAATLKRPRAGSDTESSDKHEAKKVCLDDTTPMEEDLSDISDDDADEILNREDIELATSIALEAQSLLQPQVVASPTGASSEMVKKEPEQDKVSEKLDKAPVLMEVNADVNDSHSLLPQDEETIDNLDFEEISDEELEEEAKAGLGDALGVDWASLFAESRPRIRSDVVPGSARRRWDGVRMLARLGVSARYAGPELMDKLNARLAAVNKEEKENNDGTEDVEPLSFLHPIASIHVFLREKRERRKALFASAGPYKRALSARRDLLVRRQLCNLPVNETTVEAQGPNTEDIYRLAVQLFERGV